jgi:hypothetical protein
VEEGLRELRERIAPQPSAEAAALSWDIWILFRFEV